MSFLYGALFVFIMLIRLNNKEKQGKTWRLHFFSVLLSENSKNMTAREDKEKEKTSRETLGKFFYDLAKTCFAAMVVTNAIALALGDGESYATGGLLFVGIIGTFIFARVGYIIIKK